LSTVYNYEFSYAALGLLHTLDPLASGGSEPQEKHGEIEIRSDSDSGDVVQVAADPPSSAIPSGFGRIVRDEAGNVVRIELGEEDRVGEKEKDMEELAPEVERSVQQRWVTELGGTSGSIKGGIVVGGE
jgi:nucleolar protein 16